MKSAFRTALERYGQSVALHYEGAEETVSLKAFVQTIPNRSEEQTVPTPLGLAPQQRFLYLGDPDGALERLGETGYVLWQGGRYRARAAHPVYVGDCVNHWWAVLEPWEESDA